MTKIQTRIHIIKGEASVNFNIKREICQPHTYFAPSLPLSVSLTHRHTRTHAHKHEKLEKKMLEKGERGCYGFFRNVLFPMHLIQIKTLVKININEKIDHMVSSDDTKLFITIPIRYDT